MRIAIIGPIGAGKSTVLELFKQRGFKTIQADQIVDYLYDEGKAGYDAIWKSPDFGESFLANGEVDRELLIASIRKDKTLRQKLEDLIHPLINDYLKKFSNIICEIPILSTSKTKFDFDQIIYVYANKETCLDRLETYREMDRGVAEMIYDWFSLGSIEPDFELDTSAGEGVYEDDIDDIIEKLGINDYELD